MKKLMTLVLAASFILGTALTASAVEITANGSFDFTWGWYTNKTLFDNNEINRAVGAAGNNPEVFDARQRERLQVNFIASENVQGVVYFEIGETVWGGGNNGANVGRGTGGAAGTDGVSVEVRRAYIDFNVPNTDLLFRVGLQGIALPSAVVGNPVLGSSGTDMAAVVGVYTINDMVTVGALWGRPWNTWQFNDLNDSFDVFALYVPITIDGMMTITPWAMYGIAGTDALYGSRLAGALNVPNGMLTPAFGSAGARAYTNNAYQYMWWAGGSFEFTMLDPLTFALDVVWGTSIDPSDDELERHGWYLAGRVDYQTPYVTPGLVAWWTTGEDDDIWNGSERLPELDGTFQATTYGFDGQSLLNAGDIIGQSAEGTWGLSLQFNDISFIEDLTHALRISFIGGTNDPESLRNYRNNPRWNPAFVNPSGIMLTTADYAWEIDFDHKYQIYENLAAIVEMAMVDVERQAYPWRSQNNRNNVRDIRRWKTSTAWKLAMGLQYRF